MSIAIPHIIDQYAEEAAFLWLLRNNAVYAPHYDLIDLAKLDERIEAHLDGLRISGEDGWQACCDSLNFKESGEVFAAGVLALEGSSLDRLNLVCQVVESAPETFNGLVTAFAWVDKKHLEGRVSELLASSNALWRRLGITACVIHRVDPDIFLEQAVLDTDISLKITAIKAVGELGRVDLKAVLLEQLAHSNEEVRFWSAWSAVLIGDRAKALSLLQLEIESNTEFCIPAMQLVLPVLDQQSSNHILTEFVDNEHPMRLAIIGAGISGNIIYIHWLIQHMKSPEFARIAGEAFSHICGVDMEIFELKTEITDNDMAMPNDDLEDEDVTMDDDEDLPLPDPLLVREWWRSHQHNFKSDIRYIFGKPCSQSQCHWLLKHGSQILRYAAALNLALMQPDQALFEVSAVGKKQQQALKNL